MSRLCAASGCTLHPKGYSPLCPRHRSIQARHGHPEQTAVLVHELKGYRRQVAERRRANPNSAAWSVLEGRWRRLQDQARITLAAHEAGKPGNSHEVQAARQLQAIAGAVPASTVIEVALAMVMLWSAEPRRFRSDNGFDHQLVRRIRSLANMSAGSYYSHKTKRVHRVYRDLPPRTVRAMAYQLKVAFGAAGVQLHGLERAQVDAAHEERQRLQEALLALR